MNALITNKGTSVIVENIPEIMRWRTQWVNWRYETRGGRKTKIPYTPRSFERASSTDLMTWSTIEDAMSALRVGNFNGIGFVFCSADPFIGVDLDGVRDPLTGQVEQWATEVINRFTDIVHLEVSPSGSGIHLITRGVLKNGKNKGRMEIYGQDRFFTMTGVLL